MKIAIVACLHGNERYGLEVARRSALPSFIAHSQAIEKNMRFIEEDMNRCFPGKKDGTLEQRIAHKLMEKLKPYDLVIDLHSTSNTCPLFGIITSLSPHILRLACALHLKKLVYFPKDKREGTALIDVKPGISLEVGPHDRVENAAEIIKAIESLDSKPGELPEVYEVFSIIKQKESNIIIKNFQDVQKGEIIVQGEGEQYAKSNFTAILVGEEAYPGTLCLAAKRVRIDLTQ